MNFDAKRTYGVEIELFYLNGMDSDNIANVLKSAGINAVSELYNHDDRSYWKITTDSSINKNSHLPKGYEIVSPPLSGIAGFETIRTVVKALVDSGAHVNETCGLHIHHDAHDFDKYRFVKLYELYIRSESEIDKMVDESRRGDENQYCRSLLHFRNHSYDYTVNNVLAQLDRCYRDYAGNWYSGMYGDRYLKLNFESFQRHGTIEFRQHEGTLSADEIVNWIIFTQTMVTRSKGVASRTATKVLGSKTDFTLLFYWRWDRHDPIVTSMIHYMNPRLG